MNIPNRDLQVQAVDSSPQPITAVELRVGWLAFGVVLCVLLFGEVGLGKAATVALVWGIGALPLFWGAWGNRVATAANHLLAERGTRVALVAAVGLAMMMVWLLAPMGAFLVILPACTVAILVAILAAPERVGNAVVGSVLSVGILVMGMTAIEGVVRLPAIRSRLGSDEESASWERRYDRLWERNVLGLRSPYERVAKPPGTRRILAIGDSFTWGDKIAKTTDTWPALLESALTEAYSGVDVQVINFGQRGYTTYNESEALRRLGWQFDPDLVLVEFVANDALPSGPYFQREQEAWMSPPVRILPDLFSRGAIRNSQLLRHVEQMLSQRGTPYHLRYLTLYQDDSPGWQQMKTAIREIGAGARERGVPAVYVLHPILVPGRWTVDSYPLRSINERVAAVAREAGFHVLDLTPAYAARGGDWKRWWATPWDQHPGVEAHALTARALGEYLRSERWAASLFEGGDRIHTTTGN